MQPNTHIFAYWQGTMPPIIELCVESLRQHNENFTLLDEQLAAELGAGEILEATQHRGIAHRSDILRTWMLHTYGGTWVDADLICLRKIDLNEQLTSQPETVQVLGFGLLNQDNHFSNIVFSARQGSTLLADRVQQQFDILRTHNAPLKYAAIGRPIPTGVRPRQDNRVVRLSRKQFLPINSTTAHNYLLRGRDEQHERRAFWDANAYSYHIWDRIRRKFANKTREQMLADASFLGFVFRKALDGVTITQ